MNQENNFSGTNVNNNVTNTQTPAPTPVPTEPVTIAPTPIPTAPIEVPKIENVITPVQDVLAPEESITPMNNTIGVKQDNVISQPETIIDTNTLSNNEIISPNIDTTDNVTVINTQKSKTSYVGLVIFVIILIIFVVNMDKVIDLYDKYVTNKEPVIPNKEVTNNLVDGFIQVNDSNSFQVVDNIKFYNFDKNGSNKILFNYSSTSSKSNINDLELNIELYNSEKQLIYRELFKDDNGIERNTVKSYKLILDKDVYSKAYYALVKTYSDSEKNNTTTLTCIYSNSSNSIDNYKIVYTFINKALSSYSVNKQTNATNESSLSYKELKNEFDSIPTSFNATFSNGVLNYSIDLNNDLGVFTPLHEKGTIDIIVKNREISKKWTCE